jgi:hypothetical protein
MKDAFDKIINWRIVKEFAWPWKYGERQPLPPDDLPDDFGEEQDTGDDDEENKR